MAKTGVGRKFLKKQYVANNKAGLPRLYFVADVIKNYIITFPSPSIYFT